VSQLSNSRVPFTTNCISSLIIDSFSVRLLNWKNFSICFKRYLKWQSPLIFLATLRPPHPTCLLFGMLLKNCFPSRLTFLFQTPPPPPPHTALLPAEKKVSNILKIQKNKLKEGSAAENLLKRINKCLHFYKCLFHWEKGKKFIHVLVIQLNLNAIKFSEQRAFVSKFAKVRRSYTWNGLADYSRLKGTLSRDFRPSVFCSLNGTPGSPDSWMGYSGFEYRFEFDLTKKIASALCGILRSRRGTV
jgi:hypothetical protein